MSRNGAERERTAVFTGGGSGGHIIPGITVLKSLEKQLQMKDAQRLTSVVWFCSRSESERRLLQEAGITSIAISSGKLRRYRSLKNISDLFRIAAALFQSAWLLVKIRPVIVFSKGGFVSVPPVWIAGLLHIPVIIHDSDVDPGLTTRLCARTAEKILVPYGESVSYYPQSVRSRIMVTGNPVRKGILHGDRKRGLRFCGFPEDTKQQVLLVVGGSQGAERINELLFGILPDLAAKFLVIHIAGRGKMLVAEQTGYVRFEFVGEEYGDLLAAANLVVTRGGAGVLWECGVCGKPMIIIPKSREGGSRGDQELNAELFSRCGAATALDENNLDAEYLKNAIIKLAGDTVQLQKMAEAGRKLCNADADRAAALVLLEAMGERK